MLTLFVVLHVLCTVEDVDIQFPMSIDVFPQYCMNMKKNSNQPFSEEFKVRISESNKQSLMRFFFSLTVGSVHQISQPSA